MPAKIALQKESRIQRELRPGKEVRKFARVEQQKLRLHAIDPGV